MQQAVAESERTIAVLSPAYLQSGFTAAEWAAAFARDPTGTQGLLLPVRHCRQGPRQQNGGREQRNQARRSKFHGSSGRTGGILHPPTEAVTIFLPHAFSSGRF